MAPGLIACPPGAASTEVATLMGIHPRPRRYGARARGIDGRREPRGADRGGGTGGALAHDLVLRGVRVTLVERGELTSGTTGRHHGLLHSGGRYAVNDRESAVECIEEGRICRGSARWPWSATTARDNGADIRPYTEVTDLVVHNGLVSGASLHDHVTGQSGDMHADPFPCATGPV